MSDFTKSIEEAFYDLNDFIRQYNVEVSSQGSPTISKQHIKIVGQIALLFSDLPFPIQATMDVDLISDLTYVVQKKLRELLLQQGLSLESDGHLIWMPEKTVYKTIIDLEHLEVLIAESDFVMISKSKFFRKKDQGLISNYISHFPDFMQKLREYNIQIKK